MTDALEDHEGTVSIGGRTVANLRFSDDIGGLAGEEKELAKLVEHLDTASKAYSKEISVGDQCREDQADDKQHQSNKHRYQSEWTEA